YLAILLCPFIIGLFQSLFHIHSQEFPFVFNLVVTLLALVWTYKRQSIFLFRISSK
ncbi:MAG: MFS transporter, partial [Bacteroides sp.]